jgi:hypothetical protein
MGAVMTDNPSPLTRPPGGIKVAPGSSELAPFIYCDGIVTYGISNGIVQLELAANSVVPEGTGTRTDVLVLAHLRCSPDVAAGIRDAIDKALALPKQAQMMEPAAGSKPN